MNKIAEIQDMEFSHLEVVVRNDNIEDAIRRFRMMVQSDGVLIKHREKEGYEKPSVKRRRKSNEAQRRTQLAEAREKMMISGEWDRRQEKKEKKRLAKVAERQKKTGEVQA
jgi:small subunit ribosomal protein S21